MLEPAGPVVDNWFVYVFSSPRPLRVRRLHEIAARCSGAEYWNLLRDVWMDAEQFGQNRAIWLDLFTAPRPGKVSLMGAKDRAALEVMPERIQVYRGASDRFRRGLSWTTDIDRARWFAWRLPHHAPGHIYGATIPKARILAYFHESGRGENEVVIDARWLQLEIHD